MKLFKVLSKDEVSILIKITQSCEWRDGALSAFGNAKQIKKNQQISADVPGFSKILPLIVKAHDDQTVKSYTFIKELIDPRVAKYSTSDAYDWHVDAALLGNRRTDLSFTIFLSPPQDYDGGELEIENQGHTFNVKGEPGQMLVYPSGLLHKVHPVTRGIRLVIVGWLTSHVKIEEHRQRLFNLSAEISNLRNELKVKSDTLDQLYFQLIRDYAS